MNAPKTRLVAALACGVIAAGVASSSLAAVITIGLTTEVRTQADLPLPTVDLTSEGTADWAVWGLGEFDTPGDLTPDAEKIGADAIGPLAVLSADPILDFSQFSLSPPFSWTDGVGIPTGTDEPAAMVSRENGVGSGFTIPVTVPAGPSRITYYGQAFKAEATFTVDFGTGTIDEVVVSDTAGVLGDSGFVFTTVDLVTDAPTTIDLRWEMTDDLGLFESVGISAITVAVIPEPTSAALATCLGVATVSAIRSRRRDVDAVE